MHCSNYYDRDASLQPVTELLRMRKKKAICQSYDLLNNAEIRYLGYENGPFVMSLAPLSGPTARSYLYPFPTLWKFQH